MISAIGSVAAPTEPTIPTWIYLLSALFAGGAVTALANWYRTWRRGPVEERETIARTLRDEVGTMSKLVEEYRMEQFATERRLDEYRKQLTELTSNLARAQLRIEQLETRLENAKERRQVIQRELDDLRRQCDGYRDQRDVLEREAVELREKLRQLNDITGGRDGGDISP